MRLLIKNFLFAIAYVCVNVAHFSIVNFETRAVSGAVGWLVAIMHQSRVSIKNKGQSLMHF